MESDGNNYNELNAEHGRNKHFSPDDLENIYRLVVILYEGKNYTDASKLCFLLNIAQPFNPVFVGAQARCWKMMRNYSTAAAIFQLADMLDDASPEYRLHAAECYLLEGDRQKARVILENFSQSEDVMKRFPSLYAQAEAWLALISRRDNG